MSFLNTVTKTLRAEELRSAFNSLNHDILRQQGYNPPTPPLSPESPTTTHMMLGASSLRSANSINHDAIQSAFESRGEPTSVISCYDKARTLTSSASSTNKLDQMNRFQSSYPHTNGPCLCCPQPKPYLANVLVLPNGRSSSYEASFREPNTGPPVDELTKIMMREPVDTDFYHEVQQANGMSTISTAYSNDKVMLSQPPPLKRRYDSEPVDGEISSKKLKLNNETIACQVHGILSLPGSREPR